MRGGTTAIQGLLRWLVLVVTVCAPLFAQQLQIPDSALPGIREATAFGKRVDNVRLVGDSGEITTPGLASRIAVKAGEALDRDKLRESIRELFHSGRFANIEADAQPSSGGGVELIFRTEPNYFNGNVSVTGLPHGGPNATQAINSGKLELGTLFTQEKLEDSVGRIRSLLNEYGYYQAKIDTNLHRHPETQQVDIEIVVTPGELARIGTITVSGNSGLDAAQLQHIGKFRVGDHARSDRVKRALARIRKHFVKQRRLEAQLAVTTNRYHPDTNLVDYNFEIVRGPVVHVTAEGFSISRGKLKKLVPIFEENTVDEDLLNEGRRNLRDHLMGLGYFDATVQVRRDDDKAHDSVNITYEINAGEQHKLTAIEIDGNQRFNTGIIRERMSVQTASMLIPHGRYSQALLSSDLDRIRSLYLANGYEDVQATSELVDEHDGGRGDLKVLVHIKEGPLVRVGSLKIEGNHQVSEEQILNLINTHPGQPFAESTIASDRDLIVNYYYGAGFPGVEFLTKSSYHDESHTTMDVVFSINEGQRVFVDRVLISGVEHTRPHVVTRAVVIHDHDPLSQDKMLQTQRNLYDLGIFNEVNTAIQNPEGADEQKDVLFQIKEARRWTFTYGLGMEIGTGLSTTSSSPQGETGVSPRVTFDVTRINFRGKDQSLIFRSHFGNLQKRASLSFDQPHWFDLRDFRFTLTGLYDNTRDVNTYTSERLEGSAQLTERASKATQILYRYAYRRVQVDPSSFPAGFSEDLIPQYAKPVRVGIPSITYVRDTRDDPVNSTKGTYNTADIGAAASFFGSEADFGRLLIQNATYHTFRRNWVFARSVRIGVEAPYGQLGLVPLPERFFLGGSNSHRGFSINQAGPRDPFSGAPVGGNAMFVNNLEVRTPQARLPLVGEDVGFVIFHDMGNTFSTANQMWKNLARWSQRNRQSCRDLSDSSTCDFSYVSHAVGGGIRYLTPIGPVRVDIGYNLNPPVFPIKNPSDGSAPRYEQARHFNFFFSIGQTF